MCLEQRQILEGPEAEVTPEFSRKKRVTGCLLGLLILTGVVTLLCHWGTKQERQITCKSWENQITYLMHEYHEKYGHFPPLYSCDENGKPMHSWRVLLLEFYHREEFEQFRMDEPWDSEHNLKAAETMPEMYRCPTSRNPEELSSSYLPIVADNSTWSLDPDFRFTISSDETNRKPPRIVLIEDPTSQKLWTDPSDYLELKDIRDYELLRKRHRKHSGCRDGPNVVNTALDVWRITDHNVHRKLLKQLSKVAE